MFPSGMPLERPRHNHVEAPLERLPPPERLPPQKVWHNNYAEVPLAPSPALARVESALARVESTLGPRASRAHQEAVKPGGEKAVKPGGENEIPMFLRVKSVRDLDVIDGHFEARFRYFAYFNHAELRRQLEHDEKTTFGELVRLRHKPRAQNLSSAALEMLPRFIVRDRVSVETTDSVELICKSRERVGHDFCITEEVQATISHAFDLRGFPFDVHELTVCTQLGRTKDREVFRLRMAHDIVDEEEHMPNKAAPPGMGLVDFVSGIDSMVGWCVHALQPPPAPCPWQTTNHGSAISLKVTCRACSAMHPMHACTCASGGSMHAHGGATHHGPALPLQITCSRHSDYYVSSIMLLSSAIVTYVHGMLEHAPHACIRLERHAALVRHRRVRAQSHTGRLRAQPRASLRGSVRAARATARCAAQVRLRERRAGVGRLLRPAAARHHHPPHQHRLRARRLAKPARAAV